MQLSSCRETIMKNLRNFKSQFLLKVTFTKPFSLSLLLHYSPDLISEKYFLQRSFMIGIQSIETIPSLVPPGLAWTKSMKGK